MIHLRRMRGLLQSYADDELCAPRRDGFERHLARCERCAAALRRLRESDRLFGAARPEPVPLSPAAADALLARAVAEAGAQRRALAPSLPPFSWAFSGALVVTAGMVAAWWAMPGLRSVDRPARTVPGGSLEGAIVANSWSSPGSGGSVRQRDGGTMTKARLPATAGPGVLRKGKPAHPRTVPPGLSTPGPGLRSRKVNPLHLRYLARHPAQPGHTRTGVPSPPGENFEQPGVELVSGPLPASFMDAGGAIAGASSTAAGLAPGQMLVLVTGEQAPPLVSVRRATAEAPAFARAGAVRPDGAGRWVWTEATVQNECGGPEHSLVMLGSDAWPGEEAQNDQVWGEPDLEDGHRGDLPADAVTEPAVPSGSSTDDVPGEEHCGDSCETDAPGD